MKPAKLALLLLPLALAGCPQKPAAPAADFTEAKAHFERACSACHQTNMVLEKRKSLAEWTETVNHMVDKGAVLNTKEAVQVAEYLASIRGR